MLRRDGLLGLALCYVVGFGGYKGDEFDAAVYEQISGISCESNAGLGVIRGQYFCDYFLHSCCVGEMVFSKVSIGKIELLVVTEERKNCRDAHLLARRGRRCLKICQP